MKSFRDWAGTDGVAPKNKNLSKRQKREDIIRKLSENYRKTIGNHKTNLVFLSFFEVCVLIINELLIKLVN